MTAVDPPRERACLRCGRQEVFDEDRETWVAAGVNAGQAHCVHEWDITGTYNLFASDQ